MLRVHRDRHQECRYEIWSRGSEGSPVSSLSLWSHVVTNSHLAGLHTSCFALSSGRR